MTSKPIKTHQPCPMCDSSDAFTLYDDGHGYCFSCEKTYKPKLETHEAMEKDDKTYVYNFCSWRGVSAKTMERFGVSTKLDPDTKQPVEIGFIYPNGAVKIRDLRKDKAFHWKGPASQATLFGKDKFPAGSAKAITIVEGELDALSVYEMLGDYPVVSVRSASSAKKDCSKELDYLNSFDRVYLCFDNDEPGQRAARQVAELFDFNKVYQVKITAPFKDANDFLVEGKQKEFRRTWYNAKRFLPDGIVSSFKDFKELLDKEVEKDSIPYPWATLNEFTYGIRSSEVTLFTALEGIGKTEIIRAIEAHVLETTDANIGIIHLEETPERTLKGLAGLHLKQPVHIPGSTVSKEEIVNALREMSGGKDERIHIYSHYGSSDPDDVLGAIRFLVAACGCKYVFLDHITMIVTGLNDNDERKTLDYISTKLGMLVKELDFSLFLVSHENDQGQTRGSRNISKIADTHIRLIRDKLAASELERNTTNLVVYKNRFGARTGLATKLVFDPATFCLSELREEVDEDGLPALDKEDKT